MGLKIQLLEPTLVWESLRGLIIIISVGMLVTIKAVTVTFLSETPLVTIQHYDMETTIHSSGMSLVSTTPALAIFTLVTKLVKI